jgi:hypothetical protein
VLREANKKQVRKKPKAITNVVLTDAGFELNLSFLLGGHRNGQLLRTTAPTSVRLLSRSCVAANPEPSLIRICHEENYEPGALRLTGI